MKVAYQHLADPDAVIRHLSQLAPRTVIIDVEPLIAEWDSDQSSLNYGIAYFLRRVSTIPGLAAVCFSTNSHRRPSSAITSERQSVRYVASACKPLRTAPYKDLPQPGVVIGDQVATDGVLARRLGYYFIHCHPDCRVPLRPRLMRYLGCSVHPFLFRSSDD